MFPNKKLDDVFEILGDFIKENNERNNIKQENVSRDNITRNENSDNNIHKLQYLLYFLNF